MSNSWFQFKQFKIEQQRSALKVGTDGVLLGAWCEVTGAKQILDVGTGTGVVALMVAQRSEASVSAIEINEEACLDAAHNFRQSPWAHRLKLYTDDFIHFQEVHPLTYDLIVCNPPFFKQSLRSTDPASSVARHDVSLTFDQLIKGSKRLLDKEGRLAVILPFEATDDFRETARLAGLYLGRKTTVIPKIGKASKRVLLEFSILPVYPVVDEIVILVGPGKYSDKFVELTKGFYLNM